MYVKKRDLQDVISMMLYGITILQFCKLSTLTLSISKKWKILHLRLYLYTKA